MARLGLLISRTAASIDTALETIELPTLLPPSLVLVKPSAARTSLEGASALASE